MCIKGIELAVIRSDIDHSSGDRRGGSDIVPGGKAPQGRESGDVRRTECVFIGVVMGMSCIEPKHDLGHGCTSMSCIDTKHDLGHDRRNEHLEIGEGPSSNKCKEQKE